MSVAEKIANLVNDDSRRCCEAAYDYLMTSNPSCYSEFIALHEQLLSDQKQPNILDFRMMQGIECALWPHLYPFRSWCESILYGGQDRRTTKVSFTTKVMSPIVDYALDFELLCFQYDRWLFKTVTGAINSNQDFDCSAVKALDAKTFSPGYWQWQHRYLLDPVWQHGFPSLFLTLNPYEWSFPFPEWLNEIHNKTGNGPTGLPAYETLHIAHVLEQVVRGYLCGSKNGHWSKHVFNYNVAGRKNVLTCFYRFKYQGCGTVHLHLLLWLKNVQRIQHYLLHANCPHDTSVSRNTSIPHIAAFLSLKRIHIL